MATLGQMINVEMERLGLTNAEFAAKVGVSESHISSWRNDAKRASDGFPSLTSMKKLARALDVTVQTIIDAYAETLGYKMTRDNPPLAASLVASTKGVEDLTPAQIADIVNVTAAYVVVNSAQRAANAVKDGPNG